jgi:hypothetical protein
VIYVIGVNGMGGDFVVVGYYVRFLSCFRASLSFIYRARMASALSFGSCVGLDFICASPVVVWVSGGLVVLVLYTTYFPFTVGFTSGVIVGRLGPLEEGRSVSSVMWWSSAACCWGSVRSIRLSVGMGAVVYYLVCICTCYPSCDVACPENRAAMSIYI